MSEQNIIEIKGVEKRFGSFVAVSDLNLTLKEGEFFSLLGPSGCGKTTALRIIAGFQDHEEGEVRRHADDEVWKDPVHGGVCLFLLRQVLVEWPARRIGGVVEGVIAGMGVRSDHLAAKPGRGDRMQRFQMRR